MLFIIPVFISHPLIYTSLHSKEEVLEYFQYTTEMQSYNVFHFTVGVFFIITLYDNLKCLPVPLL